MNKPNMRARYVETGERVIVSLRLLFPESFSLYGENFEPNELVKEELFDAWHFAKLLQRKPIRCLRRDQNCYLLNIQGMLGFSLHNLFLSFRRNPVMSARVKEAFSLPTYSFISSPL